MADPNDGKTPHSPSHVHLGPSHQRKKFAWLPWLLLALGLLALLFALSRCGRDEKAAETFTPTETSVAPVDATPTAVVDAREPAGMSQVGPYLAGADATPRTFVFERLNFVTASSEVRPADREEISAVSTALKQARNARVRIVGYADARGSEPANASLGKARADSVKAALVASGVEATRIETGSGGENDPVDTNATAPGRAENRRTELVVVQR